MANYDQLIAAFVASANERITVKSSVNSIDPVDVGGTITDLAELFRPIINSINSFDILTGSIPPVNGQGNDDDLYFQGGNSIVIYRKVSGVWVNKGSISLGINIIDGNISVQSSVNGMTVRCSPGQWGTNNVIYTKATQTEFTVPTQHPTLDRIDAVFANNVGAGALSYITGTPLLTPLEPTPPSGSIVITYIYVPSIASGLLPYIANTNSGGGSGTVNVSKIVVTGDNTIVDGIAGYGRLLVPYITQTTPFIASYDDGDRYYIDSSMLQGGYLYGFPNPGDTYTFTITYIL